MLSTTRTYIEGLAIALSKADKIQFKEAEGWKTDVTRKIIYFNMNDLLMADPLTAKGFMIHEVAHVDYSTVTEDSQIAIENPQMKDVYKTYEDIRIEHRINKEYGEFSREGFVSLMTDIMNFHETNRKEGKVLSKVMQLMVLIKALSDRNAYAYNYSYKNDFDDFYRNLDPQVEQVYRKVSSFSFIIKARQQQDTTRLKKFVDDEIYPLIKDLFDKENQEQKSQSPCQVSLSKGDEQPDPEGTTAGEDGQEESTIAQLIRKGHGKTDQRQEYYDEAIPSERDLDLLLSPYINTLSRRLLDILKERASTRYTGAYLQGRLQSKNAFKVTLNEKRIFSKRINPDTPKYTITLLLDESGSMSIRDGRLQNTYIASHLLMRTAQRLRFKLNLVAYDHGVRVINDLNRYRRIKGGDNDEILALEKAREITDKTDDNIVFIMTDGGACVDPVPTIKKMQKENYVVVGIGIGLSNSGEEMLRRYYPIAVNARQVQELPQVVIETLRMLIHR